MRDNPEPAATVCPYIHFSAATPSRENARPDSLLAGLNGSSEVESFTSAENTDVSAVQFALQTVAIKAPAPAAEPEAAPVALTFWQKLLKLFGLYKG